MNRPVLLDSEAAPALAELHAAAFDRPWSGEAILALMEQPGVLALGAGSGGRLDGFILVRSVADEAEILTLAVRPEARRQGIGRALVDAASSAALEAGVLTLWLEVAADNGAAVALYETTGFAVSGRRPAYYARAGTQAADALVLRRIIDAGGCP